MTKDHLQPPPQQRRDRLDWQPLTVLAGLLVLGGVTASVTLRRRRGEATAAVTVAAAIVLGLAQLHTRSVLTSRVAEQTGLSQRDAAKHVATQYGFWLCLLLVLLAALAALIEVVIGRLRRGGRGPGPPPEPA